MAVNKFPEEVEAIRKHLADNSDGLSIKAIATTLGMNRNSVAKYLDMLQMQGRVTVRQYGSARIYTLANKLPAAAVLKISKGNVLIFSQNLIVIDINEPFRELLQLPKNDLIGKMAGQLPFFLESHPDLSRLLRDSLKGKENRISAVLVLPDRSLPGTFTFSPVFFENGDPGVALIADITAGTQYPSRPEIVTDRLLVELDEVEYICRFKPDGTLTYVNRAYGELLQKPTADLIGHTWRPTVPDSEYKKIKNCLSTLNPARMVASMEFKTITPMGESRWQRWKFRGVFDQEGQTIGYQGTGLDITEIKKLEEKVCRDTDELERLIREHKNEIQDLNKQIYTELSTREKADFQLQFTQFAMNNASYMIIWISREARFVYMNKKARQVLGYSYRELMAKKILDLLTVSLLSPWEEIWETTRRDHQYTIETAIRTRDGREIPVEMVFNYLEFKEKQYCCCFATDITGRKKAEDTIRKIGREWQTTFDAITDVVFLLDYKGRIVRYNRAFETFTGKPADEIDGRYCYEILHGTVYPIEGCPNVKAQKSRQRESLELKIGDQWFVAAVDPVFSDSGEFSGAVHLLIDITERKLAEDALRESRQIMEAILNSITVRIFWKDKNSVYLGCNTAFARDAGFNKPEDIIGKDDYAMGWRDQAGMYRNDDRAVIMSGIPKLLFEEPQTTSTGEKIQLLTSKVPLRDAGGEIIGVLGTYLDITERKRAEDALRETERRLGDIINFLPDATFAIDREGKVIAWNRAIEEMTGIRAEDILGHGNYEYALPFYGVRHPILIDLIMTPDPDVLNNYSSVQMDGDVLTAELSRAHLCGKDLYLWGKTTLLKNVSGEVVGAIESIRDITGRKAAETAIRENEERYRTLVENLPQKIFLKDKNSIYISCNRNYANDLKIQPEEIAGKNDYDFYPHELADKYRADDKRLIASGRTDEIIEEYELDGKKYWVNTVKTPLKDAIGNAAGILGIFWDTTENKRAQDAIIKSEEKYRALVETLRDWIWQVDADGVYVYTSPKVKDILGYQPDEILGKTLFDLMPPEEAKRVSGIFKALIADKKPIIAFKNINIHKEGHLVTLETSGDPFFAKDGTLAGYRGVYRDISERRQV
ncbi:MAG: PAS domain S-box protein [Methanoregula sp.]|nr:PAS domain S-box protein [Methanoregula sp.]